MQYRLLFIFLCLLVLPRCTTDEEYGKSISTGHTLSPKRATSRPYEIKGVRYYPQPHYEYDEIGLASYYGLGDPVNFHGRPTATGETFSRYKLTAAHKTLPLPCVAQVTNLKNGCSIKVIVNDRGPFVKDRIIDLSWAAAKALGMLRAGVAKVRVTVLVDESVALGHHKKKPECGVIAPPMTPSPLTPVEPGTQPDVILPPITGRSSHLLPAELLPVSSSGGGLAGTTASPSYSEASSLMTGAAPTPAVFVQTGAFYEASQAHHMVKNLNNAGHSATVSPIPIGDKSLYRVRLGPLSNKEEAGHVLREVMNAGYQQAHVVLD